MLNNLKTSIKLVFIYLYLKMVCYENVHAKKYQECLHSYVLTKHYTDINVERFILHALKFDILVYLPHTH